MQAGTGATTGAGAGTGATAAAGAGAKVVQGSQYICGGAYTWESCIGACDVIRSIAGIALKKPLARDGFWIASRKSGV